MLFFIVISASVLLIKLRVKLFYALLILAVFNFIYVFVIIDFLMASNISHYLLFTEDHIDSSRFVAFLVAAGASSVLCLVIYSVHRIFK